MAVHIKLPEVKNEQFERLGLALIALSVVCDIGKCSFNITRSRTRGTYLISISAGFIKKRDASLTTCIEQAIKELKKARGITDKVVEEYFKK